jgi:hypothetical protein
MRGRAPTSLRPERLDRLDTHCVPDRTGGKVGSPSSTSPAPAACSSRAATLTGSPVTNVSRLDGSPATTSPVLTPMRSAIRVPKRRSSSSLRAPRRACISSAARHARSASSSCASGTPKTASTASPTNFSTVPPCRSSAPHLVEVGSIRLRTASASAVAHCSRSRRSQKTRVASFQRLARGERGAAVDAERASRDPDPQAGRSRPWTLRRRRDREAPVGVLSTWVRTS